MFFWPLSPAMLRAKMIPIIQISNTLWLPTFLQKLRINSPLLFLVAPPLPAFKQTTLNLTINILLYPIFFRLWPLIITPPQENHRPKKKNCLTSENSISNWSQTKLETKKKNFISDFLHGWILGWKTDPLQNLRQKNLS